MNLLLIPVKNSKFCLFKQEFKLLDHIKMALAAISYLLVPFLLIYGLEYGSTGAADGSDGSDGPSGFGGSG